MNNITGHSYEYTQPTQQGQQQIFSRTDVATTKRALQDIQKQTEKLKNSIFSTANIGFITQDKFQTVIEDHNKLVQLNEQITTLTNQINSHMPPPSTARLSTEEKEQIRGLYQTRLYTQKQLADQYGVSQPTIGDIVKPT